MSVSKDVLNQNSKFTLPESGTILLPGGIADAVRSLPVFCASEGQASVLEKVINFLEDGGYQLTIRSCPTTQQQGNSNVILASQSYEDQLSVPAGSFLTMIGGISLLQAVAGAGPYINPSTNYRVQLYDAGAQDSISDGFVHAQNISGYNIANPSDASRTTVQKNHNLFILPSPLPISSPGQLNVQIVNLDIVQASIEMAFFFAVPVEQPSGLVPAWIGNAVGR